MSLAVDRLAAVKMATKKVEGVIYLFLLFLYPTEQSSNAAAEEDKAPIKGFRPSGLRGIIRKVAEDADVWHLARYIVSIFLWMLKDL